MIRNTFSLPLLLAIAAFAPCASAGEATVAVAANFAEVAHHLQADFDRDTGNTIKVIIGSTGSLYAQIKNGAPFDVMLAADQRRPKLLEQDGSAVTGSRFTYAVGRLTLWSAKAGVVDFRNGARTLMAGNFSKLAMADPKLAPYGAAARQTLVAMHLYDAVRPKIVTAANIAQTFSMVQTGNADLGFVALSYVISKRNKTPGSHWEVPQHLYKPIRQDAVLLARAKQNETARAFLEYLRSPRGIETIQQFGYLVASPTTHAK